MVPRYPSSCCLVALREGGNAFQSGAPYRQHTSLCLPEQRSEISIRLQAMHTGARFGAVRKLLTCVLNQMVNLLHKQILMLRLKFPQSRHRLLD